ncbi:hypothetical protein NRB14_07550 [Pseudomonas viridiflava]|uniref:hypothetical protein n=1 Tax=Pseudomonas viridiflava TaxID=33069 RepID=UPI00211D2A20|nr:hypothetical protein [Pseudomonas viridiflava]MCQ9391448.1 hypothetical protein [Pseudomonas viridiflava]
MTVIKNTTPLPNYPYQALPPDVVELMERTMPPSRGKMVTLKLFECYCDLLGSTVTYLGLSSPKYTELARGFLGALKGEMFVSNDGANRQQHIRRFVRMHDGMRALVPEIGALGYDQASMEENIAVWAEHSKKLDPERQKYWCGWEILSSKGKSSFLDLPCLWISHAGQFTEDFHEQWRLHFRKMARPATPEVNQLVRFLAKNSEEWPSVTFQHPGMIKGFFLAFMKDYFMKAHRENMNMNAQIRAWNQLMTGIEAIFLETGVWATPYQGGLPKPEIKPDFGLGTRKKKSEDGTIVHEKLLTPVPLHLTDEEAIELIFRRIQKDIAIVKGWALAQRDKLMSAIRNRKLLALEGTPIDGGAWKKSFAEVGPANICATFERDGFQPSSHYLNRHYGNCNRSQSAAILGLPTSEKLFPYQCLLVAEHPEITGSFLQNLILEDDNGDYIGYVKSETGAKLIGYKDRRGRELSEQVVALSDFTQTLIEEVIEITQPLRDYLRRNGDPACKELFLTCGTSISSPVGANFPNWNRSKFNATPSNLEELRVQFSPYEEMMECGIQEFLERVSLTSLRASCGVAVYLRTKDVTEMAKALGHAKYDPSLLGRYLPEAILAFFQTRWIRIFQRSFICEAMKDSPYLLEATTFETMDELHVFLKNHALRDIPSHLRNPENKPETAQSQARKSQVYLSIDVGIMTALLSLEAAVNTSEQPYQICGRAKYWADISRAVSEEIERGSDSLLKKHLLVAKSHCNPSRMDKIIYATAA